MYPRIRALREDHDLSQRQVAEMLGMSQTGYSKYETGENDIPTRCPHQTIHILSYQCGLSAGIDPCFHSVSSAQVNRYKKKWLPRGQPLFISYSGKNLTSRSRQRPSWP